MTKRTIGIDLAITGLHTASIMEADGTFTGKTFSFDKTLEGFNLLLEKAVPVNNPDYQLTFVMEPTSKVWIPLCCFLIAQGHKVLLVNPRKVSDLREYYQKHTKSDRIDSRVLAKLVLIDPEHLNELILPDSITSALKGYCRQRIKIVTCASARKTRIQAIFTCAIPSLMRIFGEDKFTLLARAFMRKYADPFKVKQTGFDKLSNYLENKGFGTPKPGLIQNIFNACIDAVNIYQSAQDKNSLCFSYEQIQDEINTELDLMEYEEEKIKILDEKISYLYHKLDPEEILMSHRGIGPVSAPAILGSVGDISRFRNVRKYQAFCGLIPKKKQSSNDDKQGLPIRKNASSLLKRTYYLIAETARKYDIEYAAVYDRLKNKGLHHNQVMCALARKAAARSYALMKRMRQAKDAGEINYKLRDLSGAVIDKKKSRAIVLEKYPSKKQLQKEKGGSPSFNLERVHAINASPKSPASRTNIEAVETTPHN
jgi:transposase